LLIGAFLGDIAITFQKTSRKNGAWKTHAPVHFPLPGKFALAIVISTGVREESDVAGTFDGSGQFTLMLGACACLTARADFSFFRNEPTQYISEFIIDVQILVGTELADFRF
jgi:hypothetical protein